ncbi:ribosome maturation factor RimP [Viridibacterium curvum]|uniref:Ribosome maturation factor RimP n=1 Tax=Viridibacterium curvum TaxID=1101404 RepID=A0ABP9QGT9_9RHOO
MDLFRVVDEAVSGLGFELVDLEMSPKARLLRVFIDIERGITVDDCATVSHHLQRVFEVEGIDYDRLEISSPGLDRPLKKAGDFERFAGQDVQVRIRLPIANQRNFAGELLGVRDGKVVVKTEKGEQAFDLVDIEKARLVPKFD